MKKPLIIFALFLISQISIADGFDGITLKTTKVSGNVYMLEGVGGFAGGNLAVSAGDDGLLLVDDQFAGMNDKIKAALKGIDGGDLRFVLNTHWHGDHSGGNALFSQQAIIIAHDNVRKRLQAPQENLFGKSTAQPKEAWPLITFDESLTLHMNGEAIDFIHFPNGHTDSDGVVFFTKSNVIHTGDHFFVDIFPFVDLNSGGNVISYTKNVKSLIDQMPEDVKIIPGHGRLATLDDYKRFYDMLISTTDYVKTKLDAGMTLEQIQQAGFPEKWNSWNAGFIKTKVWILFIYESLLRQ
ncbi:MAG: MBL fold metallo-hydrolase [Gammaproteobacteria bacterium]|nr:MBL fold metallo-hydrolase [Gammaproteobacteria bacterium]